MKVTWKILDTKRQTLDGVIIEVTYLCEARLEQNIEKTMSRIALTGDPTLPNFIPFSNLTEEVIIEWVKLTLGQEQVSSIETSVKTSILAQKAAKDALTIENGLPWR